MSVALIIGAGPAGLTAAYELITRTDIQPIVIEATDQVGGISRTTVHNGNRIDIGGHRFFSKSDRVMQWWLDWMPLQKTDNDQLFLKYQGKSQQLAVPTEGVDPDTHDRVMLVRSRKSRIFWRRRLFDYPLSLSADTIRKMGLIRMSRAGISYLRAAVMPIRPEKTLEEFFINRFGRELYQTFFKSYTEKVWGVSCKEIPADWGKQRIKGLSIRRAFTHAVTRRFQRQTNDVSQKQVETSLIEAFLYPKYGPGQMWEIAAEQISDRGGKILMRHKAINFRTEGERITGVEVLNQENGERRWIEADYLFSSMPLPALVKAMGDGLPERCHQIASGLPFRDFFTVGLLVDRLKLHDKQGRTVTDNWIYIQEPDVKIGRLQIFNNWSPYLVADPDKIWLGLEYFCQEQDPIWSMSDESLIKLGTDELEKIGIIDANVVRDGCVLRVKKAYPAYFGTYPQLAELRHSLDQYENLYCLGRNGQHRYNNQDHSMLTAMLAVDNIIAGRVDRNNIWEVNTEEAYHEQADAQAAS